LLQIYRNKASTEEFSNWPIKLMNFNKHVYKNLTTSILIHEIINFIIISASRTVAL